MTLPTPKNYQFVEMKTYGSTEWLADNKKKYRSVFDKAEVGYVYCEFRFRNLKFKQTDWPLKLNLKCIDENKKEICDLTCDRSVSINAQDIFVREGWGTRNSGGFWNKGTYKWEAWVDGELVAEKNFYIQDYGIVSGLGQPYFKIESIKFYEGPDANVLIDNRRYYSTFHHQFTRYIWAELKAENLIPNVKYWTCELTFNFRTSGNLLKGTVTKLFFVYPQEPSFVLTVGWGSDIIGTWGKGSYYMDILFQDKLLASKNFNIGDDYIEASETDFTIMRQMDEKTISNTKSDVPAVTKATPVSQTVETDVMAEMEDLIGLAGVKERIKEYSNYLQFISLRKEKGIEENEPLNIHSVFRGNPGTGKTTVARKLGKIYKNLGLLSKGHVHEVDRADLVAEFIGQTAPKTKAAIKKAKGGILFIDEAYSLARKDDDAKDFGKEAIEILLKEMTDEDDMAVIAAGYPDEMDNFLSSNPGLKSRFNIVFDFADYLPQELIQIAEYSADKRGITFSEEASEELYKNLVDAYRDRDKFFGNARLVNSLVDECKMNLGLRVMAVKHPESLSMEDLSTISVEDVQKLSISIPDKMPDIPIDEELLRESVAKLELMMGLEKVKNDIKDLVKLVRFYKETGKDFRTSFSLHSVFTGNPGTGKTTVARILTQIYKALGIIERGNLVECDRQSLVGGYVGQTAIKTGAVIDRAMGGVLFIDEAYSLTEGGNSDYGKEAIEIILKRMEDFRGSFIVIAAGYTENMRRFIESNPGLKSRFDRTFVFEDFEPQELNDIAINQLSEHNLKPDNAAKDMLAKMMILMFENRDRYFGNGRAVRKVVEEVVRNQHLRMSGIANNKRTKKMVNTLTIADLETVELAESVKKIDKEGIGFKMS
ncbi:MAG: SpoVK/Ycf46/Vps4 family AAA+-type ATPase [Bacteroidia bacterium]|jgi:SpoVK/Ycf46/Vps4 family AAA+-type ATPase